MSKSSVFLVDDHRLFREGLRLLLSNISFIGKIYEASNGQEFLDALGSVNPDIVFMDIEMPVLNGIETTRIAVEKYPDIRIIALSMYGEEEYIIKMTKAGAKGFILKSSGIQEVENAIQSVLSDENYFSQEIATELIRNLSRKRRSATSGDLSEREAEVLFYICKGYSNQEIAEELFISKRTVDKHRENLLFKTGSKNTAGLVMYAIHAGIIEV
jgi:DNA-binding NarL/FixJ family response regulator